MEEVKLSRARSLNGTLTTLGGFLEDRDGLLEELGGDLWRQVAESLQTN